ncbi:MAG: hypothetical protein IKG14_04165 [Clostridia bacterium]|nr:hypothetical protein [Clostridia bacterium]
MNKKKIFMIIILIAFIGVIGFALVYINSQSVEKINKDNNTTDNSITFNKDSNVSNEVASITDKKSNTKYEKKELSDGVLYSIDGKEYKADLVIGDNYFDTTINDMFLNPDSYMNKNIEIEGMYLENLPYFFVGRYSTSSLCPYCPAGYSYLEYQLKGEIDRKFTEEEDWIKIIGTLAKGNDETSNYQDFYYLEVLSLEVMNEKGQTTVSN